MAGNPRKMNQTLRLYVYDFIPKLCRRQAEVILNHENPNVRTATEHGEAKHRKYKRSKLGGGQAYDQVT
jgi:hypothetical protein